MSSPLLSSPYVSHRDRRDDRSSESDEHELRCAPASILAASVAVDGAEPSVAARLTGGASGGGSVAGGAATKLAVEGPAAADAEARVAVGATGGAATSRSVEGPPPFDAAAGDSGSVGAHGAASGAAAVLQRALARALLQRP